MTVGLLRASEYRSFLNITKTDTDPRLLQAILAESAFLSQFCNRRFDEYVDTIYLTVRPFGGGGARSNLDSDTLRLPPDLKEIEAVTNGDAAESVITLSNVQFDPLACTLTALPDSGVVWQSAAGKRIAIKAIRGFGGAWQATNISLTATISDSQTTFTVSAAGLEAGDFLRLGGASQSSVGAEYLVVETVSGTSVTVKRSVNGSQAQSWSGGQFIWRFVADPQIRDFVRQGVQLRLSQSTAIQLGVTAAGDPITLNVNSARATLMATIKALQFVVVYAGESV